MVSGSEPEAHSWGDFPHSENNGTRSQDRLVGFLTRRVSQAGSFLGTAVPSVASYIIGWLRTAKNLPIPNGVFRRDHEPIVTAPTPTSDAPSEHVLQGNHGICNSEGEREEPEERTEVAKQPASPNPLLRGDTPVQEDAYQAMEAWQINDGTQDEAMSAPLGDQTITGVPHDGSNEEQQGNVDPSAHPDPGNLGHATAKSSPHRSCRAAGGHPSLFRRKNGNLEETAPRNEHGLIARFKRLKKSRRTVPVRPSRPTAKERRSRRNVDGLHMEHQ